MEYQKFWFDQWWVCMREQRQESEEFEVNVGMHHWSVLSPFLFTVVIDVVTEFAREVALNELLYADDVVLMSEIIKGLRHEFIKWKESFESKGLKVNLWKTTVIVSGGITKDGMSKSIVDPCGVCSLRVKANSVLCLQCGKWIHSRCAGVERVTQKFLRNFACRKCEGNVGEAVGQEERLCDRVETVKELLLLARLINRQDVVFHGFGRRSPYRFHCQCGQLQYRRHTEEKSQSSIAGIGRSATKNSIWRVEKVRKFWLPAVSVGDQAAKRQLPFGIHFKNLNFGCEAAVTDRTRCGLSLGSVVSFCMAGDVL